MFLDSISSMPSTMSLAGRVSWLAPHLSNHPLQNSEHISGAFGRSSFRRANSWSIFAPVPKFIVHTRSGKPFFSKLLDQSHWKSVMSCARLCRLASPRTPCLPELHVSLIISRIAEIYSLSSPYEPYSFSTCTMMIGPPFWMVSGASCSPTFCSNIFTRSIK